MVFQGPCSSKDMVTVYKVEPQYCPEAVMDLYVHDVPDNKKNNSKGDVKITYMRLKAKKHLSAMRWVIWYGEKGGRQELRYTSPTGKTYYSLKTACKGCIDEGGCGVPKNVNESNPKVKGSFTEALQSKKRRRSTSPEIEEDDTKRKGRVGKVMKILPESRDNRKSLDDGGLPERIEGSSPLLKPSFSENSDVLDNPEMGDRNSSPAEPRVGKVMAVLMKSRDDTPKPNMQQQPICDKTSSRRMKPVVLSQLIDKNVICPETKVYYRGSKGPQPLAKGSITRDGIICSCCNKLFTLTAFEAHAGSTKHRPAANIFLDDGRSLVDCQMQIVGSNCNKNSPAGARKSNGSLEPTKHMPAANIILEDGRSPVDCHMKIAGSDSNKKRTTGARKSNDLRLIKTNYGMCSVCHDGGELVLCHKCPAAFHKTCLGFKDVPIGVWLCPSCCCRICCQTKFQKLTEYSAEDDYIVQACEQCDQKFHKGCRWRMGNNRVVNKFQNKWFCSSKCETIFSSLHELIGRPFSIGTNNLTRTLLKSLDSDHQDPKLSKALDLIHECFKSFKDPITGRDIVEDVILNRGSDLKHLNFKGFYTMTLEKGDSVISAACIRVFDEVAEIPFIATRFKYRRQGMCRLLINELEKQLTALGVVRLILPAAPRVLTTWTSKFGFSKMTGSDRLNYLHYTFLDFQDTFMCHKLLRKITSP